jgi:hypothetical protein
LQSFCVLLQEPWPLQEFPPTHFVLAACAADPLDVADPESCAIAAEAKNSAATADARIAPLVPLFIVFSCSAKRNRFTCRPFARIAQSRSRALILANVLVFPDFKQKLQSHRSRTGARKSGNFSRLRR